MKIKKLLFVVASIILMIQPVLNMTLKISSEALTTFDACYTTERVASKAEKANLKQFAKRVDTEILKRSTHGACQGSDCRGWLESKILSFCKANLLASKLDKHTFNLVNVLYKTETKGEYSHFLFSTESGRNIQAGSNEFNSKLLYRVCVPVDRKDNAYVDFKCPYSACTSYEASKTCRHTEEYKTERSSMKVDSGTFVPYKKINQNYN